MSGPLQGRDGSPFGDPIDAYTRAEAIADGVLVDVSRQASPAEMHGGFTVPVAVTASLWAAVEAIPPSLLGIADARGRLHDVLWLASLAVGRHTAGFGRLVVGRSRVGDRPHGDAAWRAHGNDETTERPIRPGSGCPEPRPAPSLLFQVHLPYRGTRQRVQTLRVDIAPDDHGSPCVTIGFPEDF